MSSLNYGELCRLCLVKESVSIPIFDGEGDARRLFLKIAACLPVKVSREDRLPKKICDDCLYKLENQYLFWNSTANAEKQLLQWFDADSLQDEKKIVPTSNLETEQLDLKQEILDPDQGSELAKSLSRVEAVLAEEAGRTTRNAEEEEEEESEEEGSNSEESEEDDNDNDADEPSKDDNESDENYEELEPTTFVNVSLACDEAGPSGMQQQQQPSTAPSTSTSGPAASGSVPTLRPRRGDKLFPQGILEPQHQYAYVEKRIKDETPLPTTSSSASKKETKSKRMHICSCGFSCTYLESKLFSAHMKTHDDEAPKEYPCKHCDMVFPKVKLMRAHRSVHKHPRKCGTCQQWFDSQMLLTDHIQEIHKKHSCRHCKVKFETYSLLLEHRKMTHRRYFCKLCKVYSRGELAFKEHNNKHSSTEGPPYVCEVCRVVYKHWKKMEAHKLRHATDDKYTCDVCSYASFDKKRFRKHVNTQHILTKDYVCDACGKEFSTRMGLMSHLNTHREKVFMCDICPLAFSSKAKLVVHQKTHDPNRDRFQCEKCGQSFAFNHSLRRHLRIHEGKERYKCEFCGKVVSSSDSLNVHRRRHTGERPYSCTLCPKTFISRNYLRSHMLVHTGEKRHQCEICSKRFAQRSSYTLHMKYHSGLKPYVCEICPKAFITKPLLAAHEKSHAV